MKIRLLFFCSLYLFFINYIIPFINEKNNPPLPKTFSPFFQQLGKPIQSANRTLSKLMPIGDIDEKMIGQEIKQRFEKLYPIEPSDQEKSLYLNALIRRLTEKSQRGFDYTVFLVKGSPNAFALPGGVIGVTKDLLHLISNEAELVAILGHEIGHIERGHLFDAVRSEMLRKKLKRNSIQGYTTDTLQFLGRLLFSKSQEDEADEYGFSLLVEKGYDPFAMGKVFKKLLELESSKVGLIHDFLASHPHMVLREAKFRHRAERWSAQHLGD